MSEGQMSEELADLTGFKGSRGLAAISYPHSLPFGDSSSEAHTLDYVSAGDRVGHGTGGHCDVGCVFLMVLVAHYQWRRVVIH